MADKLSMSLEEIITNNKKNHLRKTKTHVQNKPRPFKRLPPQTYRQDYYNSRVPPQPQRQELTKPRPSPTHLFIGDMDPSVTNEQLRTHFEGIGELSLCKIHWDNLGRSRGTGEIGFKDKEDAQNAIEQLNGSELQGQEIRVERYRKK